MPTNVIMPLPRSRTFAPSYEDWGNLVVVLLRSFAAVLVLVPAAIYLALVGLFACFLWGLLVGWNSPALEDLYNQGRAVTLTTAGLAAIAWFVAVIGWGRRRAVRFSICAGLAAVCIIGGFTAQKVLRHSPAELDPSGGHRKGVYRDGNVHWESFAIVAAGCALSVLLVPPRKHQSNQNRSGGRGAAVQATPPKLPA